MLKEEAANFFVYSCFGLELKDLVPEKEANMIFKCAHRAYLDF